MEAPDLMSRLVAWGFRFVVLCLLRVVLEPSVPAPLPRWVPLVVLSVEAPSSHSLFLTVLLSPLSLTVLLSSLALTVLLSPLSLTVLLSPLSLTVLLSSLSRPAASVMDPPFYRLIQWQYEVLFRRLRNLSLLFLLHIRCLFLLLLLRTHF